MARYPLALMLPYPVPLAFLLFLDGRLVKVQAPLGKRIGRDTRAYAPAHLGKEPSYLGFRRTDSFDAPRTAEFQLTNRFLDDLPVWLQVD